MGLLWNGCSYIHLHLSIIWARIPYSFFYLFFHIFSQILLFLQFISKLGNCHNFISKTLGNIISTSITKQKITEKQSFRILRCKFRFLSSKFLKK